METDQSKIAFLVRRKKIKRFSQLWDHLDVSMISKQFKVKPENLRTMAPLKLEFLFDLASLIGINDQELIELVIAERASVKTKKVNKNSKKQEE